MNNKPLYVKSGGFLWGFNAGSGRLVVLPGAIEFEPGRWFRVFQPVGRIVDTHQRVSLIRLRVGVPGRLTNLLVVGERHAAIASLAGRECAALESALSEAGFDVDRTVRWFGRGRGRTF